MRTEERSDGPERGTGLAFGPIAIGEGVHMTIWTLLLVSLSLQAGNAQELCNPKFAADPHASRAIEFLRTIAGYYQGDTCELSITVCSGYSSGASDVGGAQVGEVLLLDRRSGDEFYLPVNFQPRDTVRTRFEIENGRRMFHYEFADQNPDPGRGSVAVFLFEAVKTVDLSKLEYVEFGIRRPTDRRIEWAVCKLK
jgi:hypothetical protein